jgi:hypothetical protein
LIERRLIDLRMHFAWRQCSSAERMGMGGLRAGGVNAQSGFCATMLKGRCGCWAAAWCGN